MAKGIFVAATGKNIGKTTTCLGLMAGLQKRMGKVGFLKPVGQEQVHIGDNLYVDKDVVLFKERFKLSLPYAAMSPLLLPPGFTRDFLDGKIELRSLKQQITDAFAQIKDQTPFTLVEGTGHMGVGSIIHLNNAEVASLLKLPVLLIAPGGLGSSFDELTLNIVLCEKYKVPVAGIILNKVRSDKRDMVIHYMSKALERWQVPLLGCIPFDPLLTYPSMRDFELLFEVPLIAGKEHTLRHFQQIRLVASSVEVYRELIVPGQLIITPANREDIILATLARHWDLKLAAAKDDLEGGIILTGSRPPRPAIAEQIQQAGIPLLYVPLNSFNVMKKISSYVAKLHTDDTEKVDEAISIVEQYIDIDALLKRV